MGTGSYFEDTEKYLAHLEFLRQLREINESNRREAGESKRYGMSDYSSFEEYINDVDYNPYVVISDD